ncbi:MAG: DUF2147 domain-containing protein [Methyloceanibacter sp.]|uniref:DUF2147 domain-containing protein n=1 Tax=Methyloceanibacter sp. TaxID=1965321 RepID=UPI003D9B08CC
MKHHANIAAASLLAAVLLAPFSSTQAAAADPTGIWMKPDAERPARIEVRKCGKSQLCAKIIWLENAKDSKGKPLRDIRNSDPGQRGRAILGLPLFSGFTPSGPNAWAGQIYNPEDGNTYSATLTLVSQKQIVLKGCKAFGLLCGQKIWVRSEIPGKPEEPVVTPTEQIEAKAEPQAPAPAAPAPAAPSKELASAPVPEVDTLRTEVSVPQAEILTPAVPAAYHDAPQGNGFVTTTATPETAPPFSSESPSSMFAMTKGLVAEAPATETVRPAAPTPQPARVQTASTSPAPETQPKPKSTTPKPVTASAAGTAPMSATTSKSQPVPVETAADGTAQPTQSAQMEEAEEPITTAAPLTRRERRLMRRMRGEDLPWLR